MCFSSPTGYRQYISAFLFTWAANHCHIAAPTLDNFWVCKAAATVEDAEVPLFWAVEIGKDWTGTFPSISWERKCGGSSAFRFFWCQPFSWLLGQMPWSNWSELAGLFEISSFGRSFVQTTLDMVSENVAKQFSAKQSTFLAAKADETAAEGCQDLRCLSSLSRLQVAFCWGNFVKFSFDTIFLLSSMHWKSCASRSALLPIHWLEKHQNPWKSKELQSLQEVGVSVSLFQLFWSDTVSLVYWAVPLLSLWCPRQGHPSGGQEGQLGRRDALPARRPREPGEEGWTRP